MNNAVPERSRRRFQLAIITILTIALLALGFECYGRWVARNMAVIVKAGVETPQSTVWSTAAAPPSSVVLLGSDTIAQITSVRTRTRSDAPRTEIGLVAILTDSTEKDVVSDSSQVAVLVQEVPIVVMMQKKLRADTVVAGRLWIVDLPRFIPVYRRTEATR